MQEAAERVRVCVCVRSERERVYKKSGRREGRKEGRGQGGRKRGEEGGKEERSKGGYKSAWFYPRFE